MWKCYTCAGGTDNRYNYRMTIGAAGRVASPSGIAHSTNRCQADLHDLVGDNVVPNKRGNRQCRACRNAYLRAKYKREHPGAAQYRTGVCRRGHVKDAANALPDGGCRRCKYDRANERRRAARR